MKRPRHLDPPAYLSKSPPVPRPAPPADSPSRDEQGRDPTRYGDWEKNGIAIDF